MGKFWQSSKPPQIPNSHRLTASQQQEVFHALKLDKKDIKSIKNELKKAPGGRQLLNPNKRISLDKMHDIVHQHDPKLAQKLKYGFRDYKKNVEAIHQEKADELAEESHIKANIKQTREFDTRRQRGEEYMKERLKQEKLRGLDPDAPKEHKDRHGAYHTLDKPTTSARAHARKNTWQKQAAPETETSAQGNMRKTKTIEEIQEEAKNIPDLPI